jgi:hypothetical protein
MAKGTTRNSKGTSHGVEATFPDSKRVTLIDYVLTFYKGRELLTTKDFASDEIQKFTEYCYQICEAQGYKKTQVHFTEI